MNLLPPISPDLRRLRHVLGVQQGRFQITFCSSPRRQKAAIRQRHRNRRSILYSVLPDFPIPETINEVVVHHADRLHVCIDDGGSDEGESAMFKVLAERV
jgi:hypothetical protein